MTTIEKRALHGHQRPGPTYRMAITDKDMQAKPVDKDQWLVEDGPRGAGRLVGRITRAGARAFYFRYTDSAGERIRLHLGPYKHATKPGLTLKEAREKAAELSRLYQGGVRNIREHLAAKQVEAARQERAAHDAAQAVALERQRRVTVRQLFSRWAETDLTPRNRADGTRTGRKDGGQYVREQFERRVFPQIGDIAVEDVRKADLLAILDAVKAEGKLRTCNVLLAGLKQMLRFAVTREIIPHSPLESVTKRDAGGNEAGRERFLSADEIALLANCVPNAGLSRRAEHAIWLILSTGCRVGELMNARWEHVDLQRQKWHLPETKNERPHTIHLSGFALGHFEALYLLQEASGNGAPLPWVFPNSKGTAAVDIKAFGKQLADRQRTDERRLQGRSMASGSLALPGGRWTAHDLRRTAATVMAQLGVSTDVIDECLNHLLPGRVSRIYIRDRRETAQAAAFEALGERLEEIVSLQTGPHAQHLRLVA